MYAYAYSIKMTRSFYSGLVIAHCVLVWPFAYRSVLANVQRAPETSEEQADKEAKGLVEKKEIEKVKQIEKEIEKEKEKELPQSQNSQHAAWVQA